MRLILIAGMPASGKSTVAQKLSRRFGIPVLEKDAIKEELFDTLGFSDYSQKRALDVAATAVLLRMADSLLAGGTSFILVNNFRADAADEVKGLLNKYDVRCVTVFFRGDGDVFYQRYAERDQNRARHMGHALQTHYPPREGDPTTYTMTRKEFAEKFEDLGMDRFDAGTPRIEIDATYPETIDLHALAAEIEEKTAQ
ncbi:MAG: ATP-binding protein [Clostridia bacterium]|nr:ATP-binding protein [Clostridia bacterium]